MNTNDSRFELIRRCHNGEASPEEFGQLESCLHEDADFREAYVRYINLDVALSAVAKGNPMLATTRAGSEKAHRVVWLQWRPLASAAAGLVIGLFCASVAWAYASPRVVAEVRRLSALVDGNFEDQTGRVAAGFPHKAGVWSGDEAEVVNQTGSSARTGHRALRFLRAGGEASAPNRPAEACDVYQVVDLRALRGELTTAGESMLELSAEFLDTRAEAGSPVVFACHVYLFAGSVDALHDVWPPTSRDTLGVGASYILSSGGPDAGQWRKVIARCVLTPQADVAVVKLSAGRGDRSGGLAPELGGQFADDVKLVVKTQPVLPVRLVPNE